MANGPHAHKHCRALLGGENSNDSKPPRPLKNPLLANFANLVVMLLTSHAIQQQYRVFDQPRLQQQHASN